MLFRSTALALTFATASLWATPAISEAQETSTTSWTSASGKTIEAEFVRLTDDGVVLRIKATGQEAEVKLSTLSLESHLQAIKLAKPEEFSKPLVKAVVEFVPLEPTNAIDVDANLESPFTGDESIDQFIGVVTDELTTGNYMVVWHCLPPKMQEDAEELLVKAMGKVGKQPIVQIRTLMKDLDTIATEKEQFIKNYPALTENPMAMAQFESAWPLQKQFIHSLANEELWQEENFEKGNIIPWLGKILAVYGEQHDAVNEAAGGQLNTFISSAIKVTKQTSTDAEIEISLPIPMFEPQTLRVIKRGKIWIVNDWMKEARKGLDEGLAKIDDAPQVGGSIALALGTMVLPAVTSLKQANTQEEFNAAADNIKALIEQANAAGAAGGPGGPPPPSTGSGRPSLGGLGG